MARKAKEEKVTMVARCSLAIEGKHFDEGSEVTDVDDDELRKAVNSRRVVPDTSPEGQAAMARAAVREEEALIEAEAKAKVEAEQKAKDEAEAKAKVEAEQKAKDEAETKTKAAALAKGAAGNS